MKIRFPRPAAAFVFLALAGRAERAGAQAAYTLASPDSRTEVRVEIREGHLVYSVTRDRRALLLPSLLGFEFLGAPALRDSLRVMAETGSPMRAKNEPMSSKLPKWAIATIDPRPPALAAWKAS